MYLVWCGIYLECGVYIGYYVRRHTHTHTQQMEANRGKRKNNNVKTNYILLYSTLLINRSRYRWRVSPQFAETSENFSIVEPVAARWSCLIVCVFIFFSRRRSCCYFLHDINFVCSKMKRDVSERASERASDRTQERTNDRMNVWTTNQYRDLARRSAIGSDASRGHTPAGPCERIARTRTDSVRPTG